MVTNIFEINRGRFKTESMHDFILAKEILDELKKIIRERKLSKIKSVSLEIGSISLAHDGHEEHTEDISIENLEFNLENLVRGTLLEKAVFKIKKVDGNSWKITEIEI
jgi:Zn finger protein HypA/HybF involved in hydrogenase expression